MAKVNNMKLYHISWLILILSLFIEVISSHTHNKAVAAYSPSNTSTVPNKLLYQLGMGVIEGTNLPHEMYLIAIGNGGTYVYHPDTLQPVIQSSTEIPVVFNDFYGVESFAWSPNGSLLAFGVRNGNIYLWNVGSHEPITVMRGAEGYTHRPLVWSPTGEIIASQTSLRGATIILWDVETRETIHRFSNHLLGVADLAFSPDGKILATVGDLDQLITVQDVETGKILFSIEPLEEHTLFWRTAFSPDGSRIAVGTNNGKVIIKEVSTNEATTLLTGLTDLPRDVQGIIWTPDGKYIVASFSMLLGGSIHEDTHDAVIIWDVASGNIKHHFSNETMAALSPDGVTLVTISDEAEAVAHPDGTIRTIPTGEVIFRYLHSGELIDTLVAEGTFQAQWSFDGASFATLDVNKVLALWD